MSVGAGIAYLSVTALSTPSAVKCSGVLLTSAGWHRPETDERVSYTA